MNARLPVTAWIKPKAIKPAMGPIDPAGLEICDDPPPAQTRVTGSKYGPIFERIKLGQAVRCAGNQAARICAQFAKWLKVHKPNSGLIARAVSSYPGDLSDKRGRVFLIQTDGATAQPARARKGGKA
jgi:hypothetical protein